MYVHASYWLFLFFSATLFWVAPRDWRTGLLAMLSAAYLFRQDWLATVSALVSITVILSVFSRTRVKTQRAETVALVLVGLLIAQLAFHKYLQTGSAGPVRAVIPLGLSFLTFKLIDFCMRTLSGEIPRMSLDRTLLYFFLFPAFPAGPMARIDDFYKKRDDAFRIDAWVEGLTRMIQGLVKKFAVGDALLMSTFLHRNAAQTTMIVRMRTEPTLWAWIDVFALQIFVYLDFSAYSDLAIGGARLFGYRIPENFDYPLFAPNIGEFWKRWHMTLAQLCRAYIYLPVLARTRNVQISMVTTMLIIALWHGASWGWLLWGAWHAIGLTIYAFYRQRVGPAPEKYSGLPALASWAGTILFVSSACTFLVAPGKNGLREGLQILGNLIGIRV